MKAELNRTKQMNHPNIVRVEDSFEDNEDYKMIIVLEYCPCKFLFVLTHFSVDGDLLQ